MSAQLRLTARDEAYQAGGILLFLAAGVIVAALGFEYIGGFQPCPMCLQQRWAYYAGVPLTFGALILVAAGQRHAAALLFLGIAIAFLANAGLGIYQAGAEWKFWPGPTTCSSTQDLAVSPADMLKQLQNNNPVRCDEASFRFLGLSFAGWNVVISFVLFVIGLKAAHAAKPLD
jgi:disulfide bond formation protein DsbB